MNSLKRLTIIILWLISFYGYKGYATSTFEKTYSYYGSKFYLLIQQNKNLKNEIRRVLNSVHKKRFNDFDEILPQTKGKDSSGYYQHEVLGYKLARQLLFGELHLKEDKKGYYVRDVYCLKSYYNSDFPKGAGVGPGQIPAASVLNTEHTWPQSLFSEQYSTEMQKSDLHALFPVMSRANSLRGHYPFAEVAFPAGKRVCNSVQLGRLSMKSLALYFEPPDEHKGNVARAMFYFSIHYELEISDEEEAFLRVWHKRDPVDQQEQDRNERIFTVQKTRNPFVDHPDIVNQIRDF